MPQIRILPSGLRNKIAAGEVIERPASVVKELIENAVDAGGTDIRIEILHGGKRLMAVSDNGTGMDHDDALLCFERHATSKLAKEDDLFAIRTLGFRGEALPAIASVSKVKLVTAAQGKPIGVSVELNGGIVSEVKDSPALGTTIEVKDLFFNTPARKKFLKSTSTELYHIIDTVTKESLSHWDIGFSLLTDYKETLRTPPSSGPKERIMQIYGEEFVNGLTGVSSGADTLHFIAYISKSTNFRGTKSHQFIFLNKRPVKDQALSHAVYRAYEGILPQDKHPIFFLFLDLDPSKVDVNVHPAKREVRFQDRELVYHFVHDALRAAVRGERTEFTRQFMETAPTGGHRRVDMHTPLDTFHLPRQEMTVSENLDLAYSPALPYLYLGDTFIALSGKGGLTLIDHHAAHERILYEKFLKGLHLNSIRLLFPKQATLSQKQYRIILEHTHILKDFGIEAEDFGHNTIIIRSLPDVLQDSDIQGIFSDISQYIAEGVPPDKQIREFLAAKIACHSSVRGREILTQEELSALITDLEKTEHPDQCPHGRPTRIFFTRDDLKKMFKRK
jgi:DNA mismatch repair protein MutL